MTSSRVRTGSKISSPVLLPYPKGTLPELLPMHTPVQVERDIFTLLGYVLLQGPQGLMYVLTSVRCFLNPY